MATVLGKSASHYETLHKKGSFSMNFDARLWMCSVCLISSMDWGDHTWLA